MWRRGCQCAFSDLIERGWIKEDAPGGFQQETRHATSYRLENEASCAPGAVARKGYLSWKPSELCEKNR